MFKLFKRKSKAEVLDKQYQKLLKEAYSLSKINRRASDEKMAEANRVLKEIEVLESA
jgi:hypothetical protein